MYGWKAQKGAPIRESLALQVRRGKPPLLLLLLLVAALLRPPPPLQPDYAVAEFETRSKQLLVQMQEQGLNASLYYENADFR